MNIQYGFELFGTFVFAISGALALKGKEQDWMGASFTAFLTAIGGGTLRDVLLDSYPLVWVTDLNIMLAILAGILFSFFLQKQLRTLKKTLRLFDTLGIALFTIVGCEKAIGLGVSPVISAIMGMFSAVMGGVLRDTISNKTPILMKRGVYAGACLIGATLYLCLDYVQVERTFAFLISFACITGIRLLSVKYDLAVPQFFKP